MSEALDKLRRTVMNLDNEEMSDDWNVVISLGEARDIVKAYDSKDADHDFLKYKYKNAIDELDRLRTPTTSEPKIKFTSITMNGVSVIKT